jgi:hypothetical protein
MKKTIKFIIVFVLLISLSLIYYYKSDYYAESKRDKYIKVLNAMKRVFISEGVYEHKHSKFIDKKVLDSYGNYHTEQIDLGEISLEISFTSNKLTLLNKEDDVIEEIYFNGKYEIDLNSEDVCNYHLYTDKWVLKKYSTNEIIANFEDKDCIDIYVARGENAIIYSACGFRSSIYYKNKTNLECPGESNSLGLEKQLYKYNPGINNTYPKYVEEARYSSNIYDINGYR